MKNFDFGSHYQFKGQLRTVTSSASTNILAQPVSLHQLQTVTSQITISQSKLQEYMQIYEWRCKTEFPIVKISSCTQEGLTKGRVHIKVITQKYPLRLNELAQLSLFKLLYLMKQSIIGFERLYDKFGAFPITPRMIALNQQNKCKVWLNQSFQSNDFTNIPVDQATMARLLFKIFAQSGNKLKTTSSFFSEIEKCKTFCQSLSYIDNYAKQNRISIPNSCRILPKEIIVKANNGFNPNLSMNKAPKFVPSKNLRISLQANSHHNHLLFKSTSKKVLNEEDDQELTTKKGGENVPDINQSSTLSGSNNQERNRFEESNIFEKRKDHINGILQPQGQIKFSFLQKSDSKGVSTIKKQGFTSQYLKTQPKPSFLTNYKQSSLKKPQKGSSDDEQDKQIKKKENEVFSRNKWQKRINKFTQQDNNDLKTSVHMGTEQLATQTSKIKLQFLDKFGKQVSESVIHCHNVPDHHWHPSTSQY